MDTFYKILCTSLGVGGIFLYFRFYNKHQEDIKKEFFNQLESFNVRLSVLRNEQIEFKLQSFDTYSNLIKYIEILEESNKLLNLHINLFENTTNIEDVFNVLIERLKKEGKEEMAEKLFNEFN